MRTSTSRPVAGISHLVVIRQPFAAQKHQHDWHGSGALHESGNPYLTHPRTRSMAAMTTIEARITCLEAEFSDFMDQLNVEFTKTKMGLTEVVEHAKVEFVKIRSDLQAIHGNAAAAFDDMGKRIDGIEKTKEGQNKG